MKREVMRFRDFREQIHSNILILGFKPTYALE